MATIHYPKNDPRADQQRSSDSAPTKSNGFSQHPPSPFVSNTDLKERHVSRVCQPQDALSMLHWHRQQIKRRKMNTRGDHSFITMHSGITELTGEAGTGKTQACLDCCVSLAFKQKRGLYVSIGICNTGPLQKRMGNMITQRLLSDNHSHRLTTEDGVVQSISDSMPNDIVKDYLTNVMMKSIVNVDQFFSFLGLQSPSESRKRGKNQLSAEESHNGELGDLLVTMMDEKTPIKAIFIDSISALFRTPDSHNNSTLDSQYQGTGMADPLFIINRAQLLFQASSKLKKLSDQFQVPVIVVNGVTSNMSNLSDKDPYNQSGSATDNQTRPSLGLAWSCCINQRYMFSRREERVCSVIRPQFKDSSTEDKEFAPSQHSTTKFRRHICIIHSPHVKCGESSRMEFYIDGAGIQLND